MAGVTLIRQVASWLQDDSGRRHLGVIVTFGNDLDNDIKITHFVGLRNGLSNSRKGISVILYLLKTLEGDFYNGLS